MGDAAIPTRTVVWAAGVAASPLGRGLGAHIDGSGRVSVAPDLTLPGHPEVYVIGDVAAAGAESGRLHLSGLVAWVAWLTIHLFFLIGFENRVLVLLQWAYAYVTYERGARLVTRGWHAPGQL